MSGYAGADAESEHALVLNENAIHVAQSMLPSGNFRFRFCNDCGEEIDARRRAAIRGCLFCVTCAVRHERTPQIKMLDKIL